MTIARNKSNLEGLAQTFATDRQKNINRLSGEPLTNHCLAVAELLREIKMDEETVAAAVLHDTIEYGAATKEELAGRFGDTVADLVDGVSTIKKITTKTGTHTQTENLRKLLIASTKDIRVLLIRLAEKLHNLKTINSLPERNRRLTAEKALELYAPIAERIGVYHFKWQIEDWAFRYLQPDKYQLIQNFLAQTRADRTRYIEAVCALLAQTLTGEGIEAEVAGRPKHFYSIYRKMLVDKEPDETELQYMNRLHDIQAFRILAKDVKQCYRTLDVVQELWEPWEKYKDYITCPKPNGYQSLHTTVLCEEDKLAEFQIRTHEMHEYNEFGPAAHSFYKDLGRGRGGQRVAGVEYTRWLKDLARWQEKIEADETFEEALKINVYPNRVFVLTPKDDVLNLPRGATPIDAAYHIHSDLGDSCVGAKVDGKLVPLNYKLRNGEKIEILVSKGKKRPSSDWLKFVRSSEARGKIKKGLRG